MLYVYAMVADARAYYACHTLYMLRLYSARAAADTLLPMPRHFFAAARIRHDIEYTPLIRYADMSPRDVFHATLACCCCHVYS